MKKIVVDSSVSLSWCFLDEKNSYIDSVLSSLEEYQMIIPPLGNLELVNAMYVGIKRDRININTAQHFLNLVENLSEVVHLDKNNFSILQTCIEYKLTSYDSNFLLLALQENCLLATQDKTLGEVAKKIGLSVWE